VEIWVQFKSLSPLLLLINRRRHILQFLSVILILKLLFLGWPAHETDVTAICEPIV
jgi:hypothetical protein